MSAHAYVTVHGERHHLGEYPSRATAAEIARRARVRLRVDRPHDRWSRVAVTVSDLRTLNAHLATITGRPRPERSTP